MNPSKPNFEAVPAVPEAGTEAVEHGQKIEAPKTPETPPEKPVQVMPVSVPAPKAPAPAKDATTRSIEGILEEGVGDAYKQMTPATQEKFKREGEHLTRELSEMIKGLKVKANRVLALITAWLKLIPGVNRFFLIQEAKIKTDKVLALAEAEKTRRASST